MQAATPQVGKRGVGSSVMVQKGWTIIIDWPQVRQACWVAGWVAWRAGSRLVLFVPTLIGVLESLGYTPSTAPDVHILFSSVALWQIWRAIAEAKARR
jgi:hypothetical protein